MPILRKQDVQQNQTTTTTTNINYIKKFMSLLKTKFNNKLNIPSEKPKTQQNNL